MPALRSRIHLRAKVRRVTGRTAYPLDGLNLEELGVTPGSEAATVEILEYDGDIYLMRYGADGACLSETRQQSVAAAKAQAEFDFEVAEADWIDVETAERPLREHEQFLIQYILDQNPHFRWNDDFRTIRVTESGDAGWGGVIDTRDGSQPMLLDTATFQDTDGVTVVVHLETTREGWFSELSIVKVDSEPIRQYPTSAAQLSLVRNRR